MSRNSSSSVGGWIGVVLGVVLVIAVAALVKQANKDNNHNPTVHGQQPLPALDRVNQVALANPVPVGTLPDGTEVKRATVLYADCDSCDQQKHVLYFYGSTVSDHWQTSERSGKRTKTVDHQTTTWDEDIPK